MSPEPDLVDIARPDKPTPQQLLVIQWKSYGLTTAEIAERAGCSPNTVRAHMDGARSRLRVHSFGHAIAVCMRKGWIR